MTIKQDSIPGQNCGSGHRFPEREKGVVIILVLFVSVALLILAVPSFYKLSAYNDLGEKSHRSLAAMNLAEAGVERAIWELNFGDISTWSESSTLRTLTVSSIRPHASGFTGSFQVEVTNPDASNPIIESVGRIEHRVGSYVERKIRVVLVEQQLPFFDFGVFGNEWVSIASNLDIQGDVGTNGTQAGAVTVAANSTINGDVSCGPEGDPDLALNIDESAVITGVQEAASEPKEFASVEAPEGLPYMGSASVSGDVMTISGDGEYTDLLIGSNSQLIISGDVKLHVLGSFLMGSNTDLIIQEGGSLTLYLTGSVDMASNCSINNLGQDPTKLKFYGTDSLTGTIRFDSNQAFYGALYMPQADLVVASNIDFFGSIYGKTVQLNANVYVSYFAGQTDFSDYRFVVKSWQQLLN